MNEEIRVNEETYIVISQTHKANPVYLSVYTGEATVKVKLNFSSLMKIIHVLKEIDYIEA